MLCMMCKKSPATIHMTDIQNGQKHEVHLCQECAKGQGVVMKAQDALASLLASIGQAATKDIEKAAGMRCPECGTTFAEFQARGRLGCPTDYEAFSELLDPLLEKMHGSLQHVGRGPKGGSQGGELGEAIQRARKLSQLRHELKHAVSAEQYEQAARLRDDIRNLEENRDET